MQLPKPNIQRAVRIPSEILRHHATLSDTNYWALIMNDDKLFACILFYFKSTFKMVTLDELFQTLPKRAVGKNYLLDWVMLFPKERNISARVSDSLFTQRHVTSGCPQKIILCPVSYVLYSDSLKHVLPRNIYAKVYANDVAVHTAINGEQKRSAS